MKLFVFLALVYAFAPALAGNTSHGGDVVTWFNIPTEKAVVKAERGYVLTAIGRKNIKKVETVEYVRAGTWGQENPLIKSLQGASFEVALKALTERISEYPHFSRYL